jgi:hypothetical protein
MPPHLYPLKDREEEYAVSRKTVRSVINPCYAVQHLAFPGNMSAWDKDRIIRIERLHIRAAQGARTTQIFPDACNRATLE